LDADKQNFVMAAGISPEDKEGMEKLEEMGLVGKHSYGLIDAREVRD
jgi:hypothetical protein